MTLEEAIKHCKEVAIEYEANGECYECGKEHRQLAEWLEDYKQLKADYIDLDRQLRDAKSRADARWISVEDRMPDKNLNEHQIVYMKGGMAGLTSYGNYYSTDGKWVILGYEVTHWMPLPELPETEDKA